MTRFEIEECLKSFEILIDTREQDTDRSRARYEQFGVPYRKQALSYGDYTYQFRLPNGNLFFPENETISGHAVIERKMSLTELSGCFCQGRDRFQREFERAREKNASVWLLVEDATWEKLLSGRYQTKFKPNAFLASITAWSIRYDLKLIMCRHEVSGQMIREILYREFKERLERGEYG